MGGGRKPGTRGDADVFDVRLGTETLVVLSLPSLEGGALEGGALEGGALAALTAAEREVAGAVLRGLSNEEVARVRGCRPRTVAAQLASIYRKLGISSRSELAALAGGPRRGSP